ncbi:phosphatidylcholine:ceramide cholinephosphotransferase 2-like isoform X1 [Pectinophora gossypiella]|uniref:phosphatidylcholine:ceramide cholinephosphotransferase 2-like isoform X1 n=2 Tax=Pectinophora gossypiella TaxID=13191 RepID=UPI00214E01D2|nr:phosphatidylcholine:ceramide cholinephosphotransferase 2-like isoform X1 [Pectinophora gossypiella]
MGAVRELRKGEMARSPRRITAHRRSRSRSRELSRLRTQLNGKGSIQPNGDWMTISARSPDKEPSPPKQINFAEPLVASVRVYLAHELPAKQLALPAPPPALPEPEPAEPPHCDVDIATHTAREDIKGINFEARLKRNDLNNNASRQQLGESRTTDMPSQAELMQRQPLLSRTAKADAPQPTTDESDPDQEHSPQRSHAGEFIVEIPAGTVREERYPKEIWKTIMSFFFLFICVCINMMSLSLVHERLPDRDTTAPLNDIVLDNVEARDWGLEVSEYMIMVSTTVAMLVVVFHKHRFIVSRRLFFIIGLLYLYRSVTMFVTVLPVSSKTYYCSPKSPNATALLIIQRTFYLISGFGLSINGKHTYCGDYIYSGHTMVLVLSYLIVAEYSPRKLWPVHWAMWGTALLGVSFVLLAHGHYTVDVVIAYYVTTRLFWTFHSLLVTPHRSGNGYNHYMIQREWWYWLFTYLERNVRGPVPRRYDWPLPWPRTKLFSRLS